MAELEQAVETVDDKKIDFKKVPIDLLISELKSYGMNVKGKAKNLIYRII